MKLEQIRKCLSPIAVTAVQWLGNFPSPVPCIFRRVSYYSPVCIMVYVQNSENAMAPQKTATTYEHGFSLVAFRSMATPSFHMILILNASLVLSRAD